MLTVATSTTAGAVRSNNEDSVLCNVSTGLLSLADGMGGHNAGEVASRIAVTTLTDFITSTADGGTAQWPFGIDHTVSTDVNRLRTAIKLANREVFRSAEERPEYAGMGTTLTAALVTADGTVNFGNVGDSRLYLYSCDGVFKQKTRDDSLVGMLSDAPGVDLAALEEHPMKHMLTSVLGRKPDLHVELNDAMLANGELLVLCSDGLHGAVSDHTMQEVLAEEGDLNRAAERLVKAALDGGSRDNISIVIARYTTAAS